MAKTTADLLVERLIEWGVDTIFGFPGDGINGIFEALRTNQEKIRFIQVRHEEAAAFAACGYAKYTGRLGVCLATSGPGGIHLLNGLYDAKCDGQPVLAITGHTFHDLIGTHYQQDVDLDKLYMDVAAYNQRVTGPDHVVNVVDEAIKTALSYRTVAHITIPKDVQDWNSENKRSSANVPATLGQIKWEQMVFEGNPEFGVDLQPIDFAGIAMNCGAAGFTIERPEEAEETLRRALAHDGPAVVQAVVDPNEPPLPGNVSTDQFIKFSEALVKGQKDGWKILKTVMKDKIREVV